MIRLHSLFEVVTRADGNSGQVFRVSGPNPAGGGSTVREYVLDNRGHDGYLNFFRALAADFGTRVPHSRATHAESTFSASFEPRLVHDISPDVLYGYGDPAVIQVRGSEPDRSGYYAVVTSNDAPNSFPILRSRDLEAWELAGFVFPAGHKPPWAADGPDVSDYWAPEMHELAGRFFVCFTARQKLGNELAIGVASSASPVGPFVAADRPILWGNVIDPNVLVDTGGAAYLYWKEDSNDVWPSRITRLLHERPEFVECLFAYPEDRRTAALVAALWPWISTLGPMERFFCQQTLIEAVTANWQPFRSQLALLAESGAEDHLLETFAAIEWAMTTRVYCQPLAPDGLSLTGQRTVVLENDREWEAHLIEGVWVHKHQDRYYLFYAGNDFSTSEYGIGVAVSDAATGPYKKMDSPLLQSTAEWSGPGHPSVAIGPDGKARLFFHAFFPGQAGYKVFRALLSVPIAFEQNGVKLID